MSANIWPRVGCGAVLRKEGRILLVYRKREPESWHWGLPGGKVDPFETLQQAVRREIFEETDIHIHKMSLLCVVDQINPARQEHWIAPVYSAEEFSGTPTLKEPDALGDVAWFALDALPDLLTYATRTALDAMHKKHAA